MALAAIIPAAVSLIGGLFKKKKSRNNATAKAGTGLDVEGIAKTAGDVIALFGKKKHGTPPIGMTLTGNQNNLVNGSNMNETVNVFGMNLPKPIAYAGGALLAFMLLKKLRIIR